LRSRVPGFVTRHPSALWQDITSVANDAVAVIEAFEVKKAVNPEEGHMEEYRVKHLSGSEGEQFLNGADREPLKMVAP
jgi:hypothetical protein